MRVAILADIHGNLPACEAVLQDIERMSPDFIVAAGDLALRGGHPRETVQLLVDKCDALLMGNTDCYISGNYLGGAYREKDHWKSELLSWTRDQLGPELVGTLGALPFSVRYSPRRGQDLFVCHANPKNLEDSLEPTMDEGALKRFLNGLDAAAMAFGHLHFPYRRRVGRLLIADVASAGIPRDGDLRPAYGVFTWTPKGWRVQIRRVRYPVKRATEVLHQRRVPGAPLLIHKMLEGRYRHHQQLLEAARRHSGLPPPPLLRPPPGMKPDHRPHHPDVPAIHPPLPDPELVARAEHDAEDSLPDAHPLTATDDATGADAASVEATSVDAAPALESEQECEHDSQSEAAAANDSQDESAPKPLTATEA